MRGYGGGELSGKERGGGDGTGWGAAAAGRVPVTLEIREPVDGCGLMDENGL